MRARLALRLGGKVVELREVELKNRPDALRAISPKATVPILQLTDGTVLEQSLDLMKWALGCDTDDVHVCGVRSEEMDALIELCDTEFKHHLDRYKYSTRYDDVDPGIHQTAATEFLNDLESRLEKGSFLFGGEQSFADLAIAPFVRQFANTDRNWFDAQPWPRLIHWLNTFTSSELFLSVMDKHQPWQPEHQNVLRWPSTAR
jgi:glutathione S-transferase